MHSVEQHAKPALADRPLSNIFLWQKDTLGVKFSLELCRDAGVTNQFQRLESRVWPAFPDRCSPKGLREKPSLLALQSDRPHYTEPPCYSHKKHRSIQPCQLRDGCPCSSP